MKKDKTIEWFLRLALSAGFLSAVADRFGLWPAEVSAWGNWEKFLAYTKSLMPFAPAGAVPFLGWLATALEVVLGLLLLTPWKTTPVAIGSGLLLLLFGLSMAVSKSIKAPLDFSVFTASAAAFALALLVQRQRRGKSNDNRIRLQ